MIIKKLDLNSLTKLKNLHQFAFNEKINDDYFIKEFHHPLSTIIGIEDDDQLLAYLDYWQIDHEIEIIKIAVDPNFRRKGYAKILLNSLFQKKNIKKIFLEVSEKNQSAIQLYQKLGFDESGERKKYYQDGSDAILMKKNLF